MQPGLKEVRVQVWNCAPRNCMQDVSLSQYLIVLDQYTEDGRLFCGNSPNNDLWSLELTGHKPFAQIIDKGTAFSLLGMILFNGFSQVGTSNSEITGRLTDDFDCSTDQ